jgi:general nucleoside transport system ATP-binding protein
VTALSETAAPRGAAVRLHGITKRFPGVLANDRTDFEAAEGEVHALLGENGAGKTTLSNILTGLYRPDEGTVEVYGRQVDFHSPRDALDAGIGMVHQHFRLVAPFTVAENVALGDHRGEGRTFLVHPRGIERHVTELGRRYGIAVNPRARIWQLSIGEQQRVEILKALYREARILILDEPTAVLTPQEAESLFVTLRAMAAEGRTVIFISHKLHEVKAVADRVTVLRAGRTMATVPAAEATPRSLAALMVGREIELAARPEDEARRPADDVVLALDGLRADGDRGGEALCGVTLEVRAGEIVAIAGVAGNGQRELAETITGIRSSTAGTVAVAGRKLRGGDPREAIGAGVGFVPEDRLATGVAPSLSLAENLVLKSYRGSTASMGPFLRLRRIGENARRLLDEYGVRAAGPGVPARQLSGGNLQKVVLAREFSADPRVLVAASPTRGLDVAAIEGVHGYLRRAAAGGVGVLLISEDLDEILALADRVAVMYEGAIVGEADAATATHAELGLMMAGGERA